MIRKSIAVFASGLVGACSSPIQYDIVSPPRDWNAHPAVVELAAPSTVFAVSDVHGGYARFVTLLANAGITAGVPDVPSSIRWAAGGGVLVVTGDLFDKGPQGIEVIDALMTLQTNAASAGGRVIVTLGNHEAEFLADPGNGKADASDGLDAELHADAIDPISIASGADPRGAWLRDQPFAARVGTWFFAHAGNTKQRSVADLESALRASVEAEDYAGEEIAGADSLLESHDWFDGDATIGARTAHAVGAEHVVFGHAPHALGPEGQIALAEDGALFRIDCGMSPDVGYSEGVLLRVHRDGTDDVAESVGVDGVITPLWRGTGTP